MFSDSVYGGKEAARRAARKFKRSAMSGLARIGLTTARKGKSTKRRSTARKTTRRRRR